MLCCALPSLLALLGLGATVGAVLSAAPWLVTLSHHKALIFTLSGVLIALSFIQVYAISPTFKKANEVCPPDGPTTCESASRFSRAILWIAATLYTAGFVVAYVLGPILNRFER
jgi:mercuric ion transport protein